MRRPTAGAADGRINRTGPGGIALGVLVLGLAACGEPGLENVPPGWEQAKVITLHSDPCGVDYQSEMAVSYKTTGNQVRIIIEKLSMMCLPRPNAGRSAAMRSRTSKLHEILIHPVEPLGAVETCNCRSDVEAIFELEAGEHQVDIYTWSRWGDVPWKVTSVDVSL